MVKNFDNKYLLKVAEELSELVCRILQEVNKNKDYSEKIFEEIRDVKLRISEFEKKISDSKEA